MKRILLMMAVMLMTSRAALAAPAKPQPFTHIQSDGTSVTLVMQGGEFIHSLMTLDGLTVGRNAQGDYCYMAAGEMSTMLAHDQGNRSIEEQAFVIAYRDQMTLEASPRRVPRRTSENDNPQVPTMGSPRIPVILADYSDVHFIHDNPVATFQSQFNEMEGSCLHYFQSQSRGQFSPQFEILGPVRLSQSRAYYGTNVRTHGTEVDAQLGTMIYDACTGLEDVDFSRYDNDGDGNVDVVVVLYAGVGEAQASYSVPESVWPCQWDMQESYDWGCSVTGPFELDGVTINRYAVFNELEGSSNYGTTIDGIGTFCHEFGHCLGLPDFYNTASGYTYGMSNWSIMDHGCYANNGHTPVGYTSYERHFMGWMDLTEGAENTYYTMSPLNTDDGTAVKVANDANPDEYYLLEYRTRTGWDSYLPAEGILVLHVDYEKAAWDANTPNNNSSHPRMTIIPADNTLSSYTNSTDTWPQGARDSLTNNSIPAARVYAGGYMNKPITEMRVDQAAGTAGFWLMKADGPLLGDVNLDGEVNIADVTALIDIILDSTGDEAAGRADINQDGEVGIGDVTALIDLLLS